MVINLENKRHVSSIGLTCFFIIRYAYYNQSKDMEGEFLSCNIK